MVFIYKSVQKIVVGDNNRHLSKILPQIIRKMRYLPLANILPLKLGMMRRFFVAFLTMLVCAQLLHIPARAESRKNPHAQAAKKRAACSDKKDNDGDGLVDYPKDPGCRSRLDNKEKNAPKNGGGSHPGDHTGVDLGVGASFHGARPLPDDNPWNQDISTLPVDPNSANLIASIGATTGLHPDFGTVWEGAPIGIPYVVVNGDQAKQKIQSFWYPDESDDVGYPIPNNPPIEGGSDSTGDRHILMVDRDNWKLYELYAAEPNGTGWNAGSGAVFDLNSNALRPAGYTSADAAGLPIFPGLVRYDEVIEQGEIRHALRFTVQRSRKAYVSPARHFASSNTDPNLPPMGMRVRLKSSVDISSYPQPVQVILRALKKYGMFVADNGSNWFISGAPDSRWDDDVLSTLRNIKGSDFEVIQMGSVVTE